MTPPSNTKLEQETRQEIDNKLEAAGWVIQDKNRLNLYESLGVAVRKWTQTQAWRITCCSLMVKPAALSKPSAKAQTLAVDGDTE